MKSIKKCLWRMASLVPWVGLITPVITASALAATPAPNPEKEAAFLGKNLKPIGDEEWKTIAASRISEKYTVLKGDTLVAISKKLFGDVKYWPKIWALNNKIITNPHHITPGTVITFSNQNGNSLDSDSIEFQKNAIAHSTEWKNLPKQKWESFVVQLPPEIDPLGFDKRDKISIRRQTGFELQVIPATQELKKLGEIMRSRTEGLYITVGDTVYIRAEENLQIGQSYGVTGSPTVLKPKNSDRKGYSYPFLGKIKILGVKDHLFIGNVIATKDLLPRGSFLIPLPERIPMLIPIPGPSRLKGVMMIDEHASTHTSAQYKEVFIDRGTEDGIKQGMVFRAYKYKDTVIDKVITQTNFIVEADIMVTQLSEKFSAGIIISSNNTIEDNSPVILITHLESLKRNDAYTDNEDHEETYDSLDKLDSPDDPLGQKDKKEIKQLEQWKKNPAPVASPAPAPVENKTTKPELTPPKDATEVKNKAEESPPPPENPTTEEETPPPPPTAIEETPAPPPPTVPQTTAEPQSSENHGESQEAPTTTPDLTPSS